MQREVRVVIAKYRPTEFWMLLCIATICLCSGCENPSEPADVRFAESRFLRKPDLFTPLLDPPVVSADAAKLDDDSEVLGIVVNGTARAYSVPTLYYHHVINDMVEGQPVLITYCGMCSSGSVFDARVNGERSIFSLYGAWQGTAAIYDTATRSVWLHLSGECIEGELEGSRLASRTVRHVLWKEWKRDHPDSTVVVGGPREMYPPDEFAQRGSSFQEPFLAQTIENKDPRYPQNELLFGVSRIVDKKSRKEVARAYPFSELRKSAAVINDVIGATPVVISFDKATKSASGFSRDLDGQTLEFQPGEPGHIVETKSGSVFSLDGVCTSGALVGKKLSPIFGIQAEWYGWYATYPETSVFTSKES